MQRASSVCGHTSACGEPAPHADTRSLCAESHLRMLRQFIGVWTPSSTCRGIVLTCGDLSFKSSQSSHFITTPALIVALSLACLMRSLFSRHCQGDFFKAVTEERPGVKDVAGETKPGDGQNRKPECTTIILSLILVSCSY